MHRVQKLMSNYGYCSRRKAEEIIQDGRVKVNGKPITIGDKATEEDEIMVDNKPIKKERKVYYMLNKPTKCVTALTDDKYETVMEHIKVKERVFPVGRLDYFTSGLLLFTNDGDFANKITHPSNEIKKSYVVKLNRPIDEQDKKSLQKGIKLEDGKTSPARLKILGPQMAEITIHEGKNRIVRRMFEALGFKLSFLERVKIGKLDLGSLPPGKFKVLSKREKELIFS
ncbi:rRNA pseudouridine synthase [Candidatus Woesearchaeota archaeon]|nr:rRNA pseudouridine synthase [Candidatus Woesearchaeota archaeon]MBT4150477.1 rRNA pseudouridine synthase [Candidatus Woesearchaeota archaeon]MBT4247117.1 rRNA pseudouridine synthase [Candidatus Woesearchaeota archaeon]MBT4434657.1 rRNA pseudouridine synthase [Candidatus Woesearchaeota archaeon]MBT7332452.1 rRNA pseudouridine synthase [Candidatus Woesearchaeota archaeon]